MNISLFQAVWSGAFETKDAIDVTLENNICAGSERGCFWIDGQACATPEDQRHHGNVAHSGWPAAA